MDVKDGKIGPILNPDELSGKRGLLVKLRYIGDTLSILPVIDNLKSKLPELELDVMVNRGTELILSHHPGIRRIWAYDRKRAKGGIFSSLIYHFKLIKELRRQDYHFIIDFTLGDRASLLCFMTGAPFRISYAHGSTLSQLLMNHLIGCNPNRLHIVDLQLMSLSLLGLNSFNRELRIPLPDDISERIDRILKNKNMDEKGIKLVIHPGARGELRRWRPENFGTVARKAKEKYNARILLVGGSGEETLIDRVESSMGDKAFFKSTKLNLIELAGLLKRCHLFIGNDSAPGHVAAGVGCPTVTLFGPTYPHMWRPLIPRAEVIFKNPDCCGCRQIECFRPHQNCMDMITVDEVWDKVDTLLKNTING